MHSLLPVAVSDDNLWLSVATAIGSKYRLCMGGGGTRAPPDRDAAGGAFECLPALPLLLMLPLVSVGAPPDQLPMVAMEAAAAGGGA